MKTKTILGSLAASLVLVFSAFGLPSPNLLRLTWSYPYVSDISTNTAMTFTIYTSTNPSLPLTNWTPIATVPGTNLTTIVPASPGWNYYTATASSAEAESQFSNVAQGHLPNSPQNLQAGKP